MRKSFLFFIMVTCLCVRSQAQSVSKDTTLQEYVGKYVFPSGSVIASVSVSIEDGALSMSSSVGTSPMVKDEGDLYGITAFNGTARFNRDSNKKITGITVNARGYELEGTKNDNINLTLLRNKKLVTNPSVVTVSIR